MSCGLRGHDFSAFSSRSHWFLHAMSTPPTFQLFSYRRRFRICFCLPYMIERLRYTLSTINRGSSYSGRPEEGQNHWYYVGPRTEAKNLWILRKLQGSRCTTGVKIYYNEASVGTWRSGLSPTSILGCLFKYWKGLSRAMCRKVADQDGLNF